ncbi:MAG: transcription repressor NadR [Lachnospiraceae bacterium]|nr:transcription repressor NadR [Lachnospiraceae bacterium]
MTGKERRQEILRLLGTVERPMSGKELAEQLSVSRQIIVQDIALLRANGTDILSTRVGYLIPQKKSASRVFKVCHSDEEVEKELALIVDYGGIVSDVFVYHKAYGILRADMNIRSRLDIRNLVEDIRSGKSTPLKNITSGYHYHTVIAENEHILDLIQTALVKNHYLAELRDYEPVDFWEKAQNREGKETN